MKKSTRKELWITLAVLILAGVVKLSLSGLDSIPFNSDEAVVALMARHILQGEKPIFFYGQVYMGSLDAIITALFFAIFGQNVGVIRYVQTLLYLGTIITTVQIGKIGFRSPRTGILAGLLLAVPAVNGTLYTTASLGGYGEALLIGNLMVLTVLTLDARSQKSDTSFLNQVWWTSLLGFWMGFGLWVDGLTLIYSVPCGLAVIWLVYRDRKAFSIQRQGLLLAGLVAGLGVGAGPWWFALVNGGGTSLVNELFGSAVAVETVNWFSRFAIHARNMILLGWTAALGIRPPWEVRWLALPLLPVAIGFWLAVGWFSLRKLIKGVQNLAVWIFAGVWMMLTAGFLFTSFGADPSGRYFLPLAIPMALAGAVFVQRIQIPRVYKGVLIGLILTFNLWGTIDCALRNPPGITTQFDSTTQIDHHYDQELIDFLRANGETRGYTTYWVAYPLAFQSQENLIYIPRLPYHADLRYTPRDDRYEPYQNEVIQSSHVAYITANNPELDRYLLTHFLAHGVAWKEKEIGDYHIFYQLKRAIRPDEMGLGIGDGTSEGSSNE
jgi:4-amino-4-deoxy-L-arabinose transferase-like glycosyltransferase